jgi:hypothetical protein
MPALRHLKVVGPTSEKCALPVRKPNAAYRSRDHLTEREVDTELAPTRIKSLFRD